MQSTRFNKITLENNGEEGIITELQFNNINSMMI